MRNETILKKALHEAMTEKYSEELINMKTPDYEFSESFNIKMRNLIRRTDNPFYRYSKYLTLAACAVIAVGCAVLIPALNSKRIHTGTGSDITAETSEVIITTVPTEAPLITETVTTVPKDETTVPKETVDSGDGEIDEPEEKPDNQTEIKPSETSETTEKAPSTSETADKEGDEEEKSETTEYEPIGGDGTENDEVNPGTGGDTVSDDEVPEIEEEEDISGEIEEEVEDDGDYDVIDGDEVDEDIVDEEVAEDEEEEVVEEPDIDNHPPYPEAETLGELYTKLYQQDFNPPSIKEQSYKIENANILTFNYDDVQFSTLYNDFDFVKEFLREAGTAKKTETVNQQSDCATIRINPVVAPYTVPSCIDSGDIHYYREIYFGEYSEDEVDVDEEPDGQWANDVELKIYRTGLIQVSFVSNRDSVWFTASSDVVGRFFNNVDNMSMSEAPSTLNDVIIDRNVTEANICRGYGNIRGVYDYYITGINLNSNKSIITNFLNSNRDKRLTYYSYSGGEKIGIEIFFGLKDSSSFITLRLLGFDKAVISVSGGDSYAFGIDKSQYTGLFKSLVGICGYSNPVIYNTMEDYIRDKGFNSITTITYNSNMGKYTINGTGGNKAVLEEIRQLILTEAKTAVYSPDALVYGDIIPNVPNWYTRYKTFTISTDGAMYIRNNRFSASASFIEKLKKLIVENGVMPSANGISDGNNHNADEEEEVIDEEEVVDEEEDMNPITQ